MNPARLMALSDSHRVEKGMKKAIIIGGGIGGLTTAIALGKIGIAAAVYERAEAVGEVGAGLVVWANAIGTLRQLGLADEVIAAGAKIEHGQIRTWTGEVLAKTNPSELERTFGEPSVAIHRAALHEVLLRALPEGSVHLGATCTGVVQDADGVTARFADSSEAQGELLVGADGLRSTIRQQIFAASALRYAGYTAWRGVVKTDHEIALGITSESWGCGNRFGILRLDEERVYWFATANSAPGKSRTPAENKVMLQGIFGGWHHPVTHLLELSPAETILHNDIYDVEPMQRWHAGRIVLLGDAAHATTPNMGQGACMAIESAGVLAECLAQNASLEAALDDYEARRRPRTAWITRQSWQIGRAGQLANPLACALRNSVVRWLAAGAMSAQLKKVIGNAPAIQL